MAMARVTPRPRRARPRIPFPFLSLDMVPRWRGPGHGRLRRCARPGRAGGAGVRRSSSDEPQRWPPPAPPVLPPARRSRGSSTIRLVAGLLLHAERREDANQSPFHG